MPETSTRQQIVETADRLFYQNGFANTSFGDIAEALQISRGNFYYHFKTKDEILAAVIEYRLSNTRAILDQWESGNTTPLDRIGSFINILMMNWSQIRSYGCPVGTLCTELSKLDHLSRTDAARVFLLFKDWLTRQFRQMGRKKDAEQLAMHLLARSQGIATMASAFQDQAFVKREVESMLSWVAHYAPSS